MEITSSSAPVQNYNGAAAPTRDTTPTELPKAQTVQEVKSVQPDTKTLEKDREELVRQAAQSFKNTFAVSDVKFTIFKDSSGQYITRFTNLNDGKVTYIPEPDMLTFSQIDGRSDQQLSIDV